MKALVQEIAALRADLERLKTQENQRLTLVLPRSDLTIASDAVTVVGSYHRVDTEAGAATDNLATINGGVSYQIVVLQTVNNARDVTVKHGTGNIYLNGSADFTLDHSRDVLVLIKTGSEWNEVCRSNNG